MTPYRTLPLLMEEDGWSGEGGSQLLRQDYCWHTSMNVVKPREGVDASVSVICAHMSWQKADLLRFTAFCSNHKPPVNSEGHHSHTKKQKQDLQRNHKGDRELETSPIHHKCSFFLNKKQSKLDPVLKQMNVEWVENCSERIDSCTFELLHSTLAQQKPAAPRIRRCSVRKTEKYLLLCV